jgi:hypothetical protein
VGIQECLEIYTSLARWYCSNLRDTERLDKREREKVEEVTARALGAMDLGERSDNDDQDMQLLIQVPIRRD